MTISCEEVVRTAQVKDIGDLARGKGAVNGRLVFACAVFCAASFVFGYDDKLISPVAALPAFVDKYQGPNPVTGRLVLTARNQDLVFSLPLVGSILGGLLSSPLNYYLGRKWPVILAYVVSVGGGLLQVFAPNLGAFVGGRSINGVAMGIAMATAPLYLSEVVPASMRGRSVTSINILNLTSGVVGTVIVWGTQKLGGHLSFQIPLAIQSAIPVILLLLTILVPESPMWLVAKNRLDEARANLRNLRGFTDEQVDDELRLMQLGKKETRQMRAQVKFWHIFKREHLRRTLVAGSFYSLNQVSGIILSTTYATVFLTQLGVVDAFSLTVIASCCTLAGTIVAPLIIDRAGRRPTAFFGMSILFVIDLIAGVLAFYPNNQHATLAVAALSFIFNFFWASSFCSLAALMPSEMATPKLRHHTMSYTIACQALTAVITTLVVPQLTSADAAGLGAKTYLVFAGCMAAILVFYFFYMPETRGRTFVEIDDMYAAKIPAWKWRSYRPLADMKVSQEVVTSGKT
ncbi:MFS-type Sugar/inositol transporter [Penicillium ucsense]|uniref:MFS-type Sugar/inositol transporter n=1 Tax=Penicillium ucsense TaxID=2839758 RepID=A0A8J8W195_9EURO|nr:MFS-type Sugar/inositol transporter [Penicillium ucsense]KAF7733046.1 MFS-type Sugar/inositol transporter [Penicillium ucsense]